MLYRAKIYLSVVCLALLGLIGVLSAAGCGGGSSGTGTIRTARVQGRFISPDSSKVADIPVSIADTDAADISDTNGNFTLIAELSGASAELVVDLPTGEQRITLQELPLGESVISLTLFVSAGGTQVGVDSISITEQTAPSSNSDSSNESTAEAQNSGTPNSETPPSRSGDPQNAQSGDLFRGSVHFSDGTPVAGAKISHKGLGLATYSDSNGNFSIATTQQEKLANVTLELEYSGASAAVHLEQLPLDQNLIISVQFIVVPPQADSSEEFPLPDEEPNQVNQNMQTGSPPQETPQEENEIQGSESLEGFNPSIQSPTVEGTNNNVSNNEQFFPVETVDDEAADSNFSAEVGVVSIEYR